MNAYSNTTGAVDQVFLLIISVCVALFILVTALMIAFVVKYHRSRHPEAERVEGSTGLEIAWTVIPTLIVLAMFWWGYKGFKILRQPPKDSMVVSVTGRMWDWSFTYGNGKTAAELRVPLGRPVKLLLHSADVIHSFFVPAFRIKEDVVPGRENYLWFKPESMGPADIFCSEYCGRNHAYMLSQVIVMEPAEFDKWLASTSPTDTSGTAPSSPADAARKLLGDRGCLTCHSTDGTKGVGPSFKGIWGRSVTVTAGGREATLPADEPYLREAVSEPSAAVVKGYADLMPAAKLSEDELKTLLEYFETLR